MKSILKTLPAALLLGALASPGLASTRNLYHRVDREIRAEALAILAEQGLPVEQVTVRCSRRRLVVYGELGDASRRSQLRELLRQGSHALSVALP